METSLDKFKKYCERHQNTFGPVSSSQNHDILVERILQNPGLINLRGIQSRYKEVKLIGKDKSGRIDLVFVTNEEIAYICEVKSGFKKGRGIYSQLEGYYKWVRNNFGITPKRMGIQLTETGKLINRVIPAEIEDIFRLNLNKEGEYNNENRIL